MNPTRALADQTQQGEQSSPHDTPIRDDKGTNGNLVQLETRAYTCTDCYQQIPSEELVMSDGLAGMEPTPYHRACHDKMRAAFAADVERNMKRHAAEADDREKKYAEIAMRLSHREGFMHLARELIKEQPVWYDMSRIWWVWNHDEYRWEISDETTIVNLAEHIFKLFGDSSVKHKNLLVEAIKQQARKSKPKDWPTNWIQFKNQIFDIQTKTFHNATPEYFCVNPLPWRVGESEDTPTISKLFDDWVGPEYTQTLYEICAYVCYSDYPLQVIICLHGGGSNGKTKFQGIIQNFIGIHNICSTSLDAITNPGRVFECFNLYKKLVCLMGETNYESLKSTEIIKKLTGQDLIYFQKKYADGFNAHNYAKIIINSNGLPPTDDKSDGFYRRWLIIDFPNQFKDGKDVLKTIPDWEYENLARRITKILPTLLERGQFHKHGSLEERKERYESRANPLLDFINHYCVVDEQSHMKVNTLFTKYVHWLNSHKRRVISRREFNDVLTRNGYEIEKKSVKNENGEWDNARYVFGLRVKEGISDFGTVWDVQDTLSNHTRVYVKGLDVRLNRPKTSQDTPTLTEIATEIIKKQGEVDVVEFTRSFPELDLNDLKARGVLYEPRAGVLKVVQ